MWPRAWVCVYECVATRVGVRVRVRARRSWAYGGWGVVRVLIKPHTFLGLFLLLFGHFLIISTLVLVVLLIVPLLLVLGRVVGE